MFYFYDKTENRRIENMGEENGRKWKEMEEIGRNKKEIIKCFI